VPAVTMHPPPVLLATQRGKTPKPLTGKAYSAHLLRNAGGAEASKTYSEGP